MAQRAGTQGTIYGGCLVIQKPRTVIKCKYPMSTYDPARIAARNRTVTDLDDIQADFIKQGHAIIPLREQSKIKGRLRAAEMRVTFRKLDERRVKVTPIQE